MTAQQRNLAEILAALVVLIGGYLGWRGHERSLGALQVVLHASDSTAKAGVAMAARATGVAQDAVKAAQAQHTKALQQLAASEALRKSTEDAARAASEARDAATKAAADSAATLNTLRAALERLVSDSRADSARAALQRHADSVATAGLLASARADSTALAAEQAKSRALQTAFGAIQRELALVKQSQPGFLARHASLTVGYGATEHAGLVYAGASVVAGWKVFP